MHCVQLHVCVSHGRYWYGLRLMPSYEYECISCSMRFTVERSIHEDNAPYCCGFAMRQVYGVPGISFKGKGWGGQ